MYVFSDLSASTHYYFKHSANFSRKESLCTQQNNSDVCFKAKLLADDVLVTV